MAEQGIATVLATADLQEAIMQQGKEVIEVASLLGSDNHDPRMLAHRLNEAENTLRHLRKRTLQLLVLGPVYKGRL